MIAKDSFPLYVLFIDLDPAQLDINVHPTKQEIKFEDEKIVYAFVQAAVKHALAQFSIAPSLDFTLNPEIQQLEAINKPFTQEKEQSAISSSLFQTFTQKHQAHLIEPNQKSELKHWKEFFTTHDTSAVKLEHEESFQAATSNIQQSFQPQTKTQKLQSDAAFQLHNTFIIVAAENGFLLMHQQSAHERILYERYSTAAFGKKIAAQQSLFPVTLELAASDSVLLNDLLPDLHMLGYLIEPFGNNTFVIQGTPADVIQGNEKNSIELLLEQFKHFNSDIKFSKREKLVRCMSRQQSIKAGQALTQKEIITLIEELFACSIPNTTPNGNPTYIEFKDDYLERMFGR
jgi:DNA mismatch repair protein MutL